MREKKQVRVVRFENKFSMVLLALMVTTLVCLKGNTLPFVK